MKRLSPELENLLENSFGLRRILEGVLPKEAIDYVLDLIAKDGAHRKFLEITEEDK